jgi:hypothetical protein
LFPPFPPVRKIFICVNLRQSASICGQFRIRLRLAVLRLCVGFFMRIADGPEGSGGRFNGAGNPALGI